MKSEPPEGTVKELQSEFVEKEARDDRLLMAFVATLLIVLGIGISVSGLPPLV